MPNILNKLYKISKIDKNSVNQTIALKIIQGYGEKIFYSSQELAKKSHVSQASLTRFAKELNFSGYKEFISVLKNESLSTISNYDQNEKVEKNENLTPRFKKFQQLLFNELKTLDKIFPIVSKITSQIKPNSTFYIIANPDVNNNLDYFKTILQVYGYEVIALNTHHMYYVLKSKKIKKTDFLFCFVSGFDSSIIEMVLTLFNTIILTKVLITSKSHYLKLMKNFHYTIICNENNNEGNSLYRDLLMLYIEKLFILGIPSKKED